MESGQLRSNLTKSEFRNLMHHAQREREAISVWQGFLCFSRTYVCSEQPR
jgi:hypothetical protein